MNTRTIYQELSDEVKEDTLLEYSKVISDYNVGVEIKRLESEMKKEPDELEKARIANKILMLRIGGENNEWPKDYNWREKEKINWCR